VIDTLVPVNDTAELRGIVAEQAERDPTKLDALVRAIGERNRVQVVRFEPAKVAAAPRRKLRLDPAMWKHDSMRVALGLPSRYIRQALANMGGTLVDVSFNTRMNPGGIDYCAAQLGGAASATAIAKFLALTENGTAVSASDTVLASEITTNGLARATASYNHTSAATSYTQAFTFTASGAFSTVQKAGLFTAASAGTMVWENTFTSTALASGDQLTVTWTISI
jgi:hypothetical protein